MGSSSSRDNPQAQTQSLSSGHRRAPVLLEKAGPLGLACLGAQLQCWV